MRFLFCSLASRGFVYPCIAIAQELRNKGHEVAFVTDVSFTEELRNLGFERIPRGAKDGGSFWSQAWYEPVAILIQVKHIEHALTQFCPDIIVGQHLTFGPLLVRERQSIPLALVGSATYLWPTKGCNPDRPRSEDERRKVWRLNSMLKTYKEVRKLSGLKPWAKVPADNPLLADLFMIRSVPELETSTAELPEQAHLIGACLWEPRQTCLELEEWLESELSAGKPVVYVHQGRFFQFPHFWSDLIKVSVELGVRVAASTDVMDCDIGQLPQDSFIRPHVPQSQVLRKASTAVLSANATAALGALCAGVPTLLIPAGGEQPDVAEVCKNAGSAIVLEPQSVTVEILRRELQILLTNTQMRREAQRLSSAFSQVNSAKTAGDLLERLAGENNQNVKPCDVALQL